MLELIIVYVVVILVTAIVPTGLSWVIAIINIFFPDAVPFIDEAIMIGIAISKS